MNEYNIYPKQYQHANIPIEKNKCFVIMPFKKEFDYIYGVIKDGLNNAGYICNRVDEISGSVPIVAKILNEILSSRYIIADLSGCNPNVFYGILGIVLPSMYDKVYKGSFTCSKCGNEHNYVDINDNTVIKEFSENYYLEPHTGCSWSENERYCVLVKWDEFIENPEEYVNKAFDKRFSDLASKVHVNINRNDIYKNLF